MLSLYALLTAVPLAYAANTTSVWSHGRVPTQAPEAGDVSPSSKVPSIAPTTYTTTFVTDVITSYCSTPTTITSNGQTITVTAPTTVTITGPCTVTSTGTGVPSRLAAPTSPEATSTITTEVVKTLTTVVNGPTTLTTNGKTYTATEATTLTITDCPCTLTHSVGATPYQNGTGSQPTSSSPAGQAGAVDTAAVTPTTTVVQTLTTEVSGPTTIKTNGKTYTATEATTLTITDCPCTLTSSHTPSAAPSAAGSDETTQGGVTGTKTLYETQTTEIVETLTKSAATPTSNEAGSANPATQQTIETVTATSAYATPTSTEGPITTSEVPVAGPVETNVETLTETTKVYKTLTTHVAGPTTITTNGATYTATEATTLTITDCPCTVTSKESPASVPTGPSPFNDTNAAAAAGSSAPALEASPVLANGALINTVSLTTLVTGLFGLVLAAL